VADAREIQHRHRSRPYLGNRIVDANIVRKVVV